jgi:hypothetical protein
MVRSDRRDAAPVVNAGPQQQIELSVDQVGRGLDAHLRPQHEPRHGHRGREVPQLRVRHAAHGRVRLGAEVLDDHFLDVPELPGQVADLKERLGPFRQRLADADQQAGGERHAHPAGVGEHPQPDRRLLVRGAVVRAARLGPQTGGRGLQHHAHARRHRLEPLQIRPAHHARVQMWQQAGLLQHRHRARPQVVQCGVVATGVEPLAGGRPALLRPIAEREEGLLAALCGARAGDLQHLRPVQERGGHPPWHGGERAVVTPVPAQPGQRNEDLLRVRHDARPAGREQPGVADHGRRRAERVQALPGGAEQDSGLGDVEGAPVRGAPQRPSHGGVDGHG